MKQALYYSIASAAFAGLLTGGAMKLGPDALSEYGGPQILLAPSAKHSQQQDYGAGEALFTSHNGEIPEYVVGTDWTRPQYAMADVYYYDAGYEAVAYEQADLGYAPTAPKPNPNIDDAVFVAPVKISSPPEPKQASYPSMDGDVVGGSNEADGGPAIIHVAETQEQSESLPS